MRKNRKQLVLLSLLVLMALAACDSLIDRNPPAPSEPAEGRELLNYYTGRGTSDQWEVYPASGQVGVNIPVAGDWVIVYKTLIGNFGVVQTVENPPMLAVIGFPTEDRVLGVWPLPAAYFVDEAGQPLTTGTTDALTMSNPVIPSLPTADIPIFPTEIPDILEDLPDLPGGLPENFSPPGGWPLDPSITVSVVQDSCTDFAPDQLCLFDPSELLAAMPSNPRLGLPDISDSMYASGLTAISLAKSICILGQARVPEVLQGVYQCSGSL